MKTEITQIIKDLKEVISEEKLNILDKDILDSALRIYLTNSINQKKGQFFRKDALENEKPLEEVNRKWNKYMFDYDNLGDKTISDKIHLREAFYTYMNYKIKKEKNRNEFPKEVSETMFW